MFPLPDSTSEDLRALSTSEHYDDTPSPDGLDVSESAVDKSKTAASTIEPTDAELLMQFQRHGDDAAFAALVRKHGPMVMAVCRQMLRKQHDAEDAFQAVWIVLLRRGRAIRNGASLAGWLYRVAHRTALRAARRRQQIHEVAMHDEHVDAHDALDAVRRHSLVRSLLDEVDRLPGQYRDALVLVYLEGKTYAQAAGELECTAAAVRGRLTRGKRLLRTRLIRQGVSLAAAMGVAHMVMNSQWTQAETVRLVELAGAAAASATGSTSTVSDASGGTTQVTISETTVSLAEEGMKTMLLTSMTTKLAATAAVLCASIGVWALQDDNPALADAANGRQPVLIAQADADLAPAEEKSAAVTATTTNDNEPTSKTSSTVETTAVLPTETVDVLELQLSTPPTNPEIVERVRATPGGNVVREQVVVNTPAVMPTPRPTPTIVNSFAEDPGLAAEELRMESEYLQRRAEAMEMMADAHAHASEAEAEEDDEKREQLLRRARAIEADARRAESRAESQWLRARAELATKKAELLEKQAEEREDMNVSRSQTIESGERVLQPQWSAVPATARPAVPVSPPAGSIPRPAAPAPATTYEPPSPPTFGGPVPQGGNRRDALPTPNAPITPPTPLPWAHSPDDQAERIRRLEAQVQQLLDEHEKARKTSW
jgi:RNA polymerase sigma factor (sigma-70 family)